MTRLLCLGLAAVAAGSLLVTGCAKGRGLSLRPGKSARSHWSEALEPDAQMEAHARYADGVIAEMQGDTEAAMAAFSQAVAKSAEDTELALDVARRFLQYRQPQRALEILNQAAVRPNASAELHGLRGAIYAQLGQMEQAIVANQAAILLEPRLFPAHQALYLNYLQTKQEQKALQVLNNAAAAQDPDAEFLVGLSELFSNAALLSPEQRAQTQQRARALLDRAAALNPTNIQTRLKLADGFNLLGESARAVEAYRGALEQLDGPPSLRSAIRSKLAELYLRTRDREQAAAQLQALLRDDPMNAQANFILGSIAYDDQKMEQAAEYFSRAVLLNPRFEQGYYDLASAQIAAGQTEQALATLEKARGRFPQSFLADYLTGVAYSRRKNYKEALKHYTAAEVIARVSETNRLTQGFYFQLGVACERSGDFDMAVRHFEKCLELAPDFHEALNYLGYMWAERGVNLERARTLIERALRAQPENAAYLDSLAWVLFKLGKPDEALAAMDRALKHIEEHDPTLYDHLGDIHASRGDLEKAREAWRKSLEIEPSETIRQKLEGKATP